MSRHLRLIAFCSALLAGAGCSGPTSPGGPPSPPPSPDPQRLAALALFESASVHWAVTTSPLTLATVGGEVWMTSGPCLFGDGSLQGSLDGVSPAPGTFLPTGSHTYVVSFSTCQVGGTWWGVELNGVASAAYNAADWSNFTATVSAESVRGRGLDGGLYSELSPYDVTADGSAAWTSVGSSTKATTYTPAAGSRLVNNSTTNVATFGGGSYSRIQYPGGRVEQRFDNLTVAINGTEYTLDGSLDTTFGNTNTHTGEVRIINNGTLVARIYGDVRNALTIEVLVPLVRF